MQSVVPKEATSYYGDLFEQFLVNAFYITNGYEKRAYRFSYLMSASGAEIDLVIERPGRPAALVEIKSTELVREDHLRGLENFASDFPDADLYLLSRDPIPKSFGRINALPWQRFVEI
jgi:predicted AAA+ superfamily ATPase